MILEKFIIYLKQMQEVVQRYQQLVQNVDFTESIEVFAELQRVSRLENPIDVANKMYLILNDTCDGVVDNVEECFEGLRQRMNFFFTDYPTTTLLPLTEIPLVTKIYHACVNRNNGNNSNNSDDNGEEDNDRNDNSNDNRDNDGEEDNDSNDNSDNNGGDNNDGYDNRDHNGGEDNDSNDNSDDNSEEKYNNRDNNIENHDECKLYVYSNILGHTADLVGLIECIPPLLTNRQIIFEAANLHGMAQSITIPSSVDLHKLSNLIPLHPAYETKVENLPPNTKIWGIICKKQDLQILHSF
jgi:hypothetical protein